MQNKTGWKSINEALPGIEERVFIYCIETKQIAGPVQLTEHRNTGFVNFAYVWTMKGLVFNGFIPTHWTPFPALPESS